MDSVMGETEFTENPCTPAEMRILAAAATGAPNKAIAAALGLSQDTVKTHLANVRAKLDVPNKIAAVTLALANGWIALPSRTG